MQILIYSAILLFVALWLLIAGSIIRRVVRRSKEKTERLAAFQTAARETKR